MELCNNETALQAHLAKTEVDAVEMGKKLLGKEISEHAANKALYVTKQMNMTLLQQEMCLQNMKASEKNYAMKKKQTEFNDDYSTLLRDSTISIWCSRRFMERLTIRPKTMVSTQASTKLAGSRLLPNMT